MKKGIGKAIGGVMVITLLCRVLSLVANQLYLSHFGTADFQLNIYSYAISIPNIVFNSVGTGISTVVVPIFAGLYANKKLKEANVFASNVLTIFGSIIAALVAVGMMLAPILPKFTDFAQGDKYDFAVKALMIIMPVMLFYGVSYVFQGVLQSFGRYNFPAAVSLPSSLVIIAYVMFFADKFGVTGLLWVTFLGLLLQGAMLIPPAIRAGFRFYPGYDLKNPHIRQAFSLILPILIGSSAFQINMFYNITIMANFSNMVTLLTFVQNLVLSTVLALVYSVTAVLYPKMTRELASGDRGQYKDTLVGGINSFVFLFIPASVGIIMVRTSLLNLISGYGKVTEADIQSGGIILAFYSVAFTAIALKELLDRGFFAAKNTKIPAICGFITVGTNILFSQIAINFIGPYGIPLAYSLSSFCAVGFLLVKMNKEIGGYGKETVETLVKTLVSTAVMACGVYVAVTLSPPGTAVFSRVVSLALPTAIGIMLYLLSSIVLRTPVVTRFIKRGND